MRVTYHKLIRDQIPGIIAADGGQSVTRVLDYAGYEAALRAKLLEEAHEAQAAPDGQLASELADVLEVLSAWPVRSSSSAAVRRPAWKCSLSPASALSRSASDTLRYPAALALGLVSMTHPFPAQAPGVSRVRSERISGWSS
jgi:predicted house-cleaning noncanonical NTP pyrophosphatase (MazG superfamily)